MKTVALISGGKDSCFNMVQCVAEGHQIVALANLRPENKDELDSYMYQTVGHQAIELYAEAMGLPLYRRTIQGTALGTGKDYLPQAADEVEDLYQLLKEIQSEMDIEAVAVGAILSDYQRVRVENVCVRLGLTPLAYLWRREQAPLLKEMVACGMDAILIKVAALGLEPDRHLGLALQQILPHMLKMEKQFGLNVCGEGGEYETFTLDCPLFHKKIVVDEKEVVIHSADAFAPVGYIRFKKCHLEDKKDERSIEKRLESLPMTTSQKLMDALNAEVSEDADTDFAVSQTSAPVPAISGALKPCSRVSGNYFSIGGLLASGSGDVESTARLAMEQLKAQVEEAGMKMQDVYFMCLYVSKMSDFAAINAVYKTYFGMNPPARICVGACLPENVLFQVDCQGLVGSEEIDGGRKTMHVQGVSHWAPANIGPYSQSTQVDKRVFVAGQIPLVPGSMQLLSSGASAQCRLSLRHADRVLQAMCTGCSLRDVLLCICYVTHSNVIPVAKQQWEKYLSANEQEEMYSTAESRTEFKPLVEYVVIPSLPRAACVEWQVYATNTQVEMKEFESVTNSGCLRVTSKGLRSADDSPFFTSSTCACLTEDGGDNIDAQSAVSACIRCYSQLLEAMDRSWSDVPLLRIFYPAHCFAYDVLFEALRKELDCQSDCGVAFSLVPVIQLRSQRTVMVICH